MSKLPRVSGKQVVKVLSHLGYVSVRQRGSHVILAKQTPQGRRTVVVPLHDEIDRGTLHEILRQTDLTKERFINLL